MDKRSHNICLAVLLAILLFGVTEVRAAPEIDPFFRQWLPTLLQSTTATNQFGSIMKMIGRTRWADFEPSCPGAWTFAQIESGEDLGGLYSFVTFGLFETNGAVATWGEFE